MEPISLLLFLAAFALLILDTSRRLRDLRNGQFTDRSGLQYPTRKQGEFEVMRVANPWRVLPLAGAFALFGAAGLLHVNGPGQLNFFLPGILCLAMAVVLPVSMWAKRIRYNDRVIEHRRYPFVNHRYDLAALEEVVPVPLIVADAFICKFSDGRRLWVTSVMSGYGQLRETVQQRADAVASRDADPAPFHGEPSSSGLT